MFRGMVRKLIDLIKDFLFYFIFLLIFVYVNVIKVNMYCVCFVKFVRFFCVLGVYICMF